MFDIDKKRNLVYLCIAIAIVVIGTVMVMTIPFSNPENQVKIMLERKMTVEIMKNELNESWLPIIITEKITTTKPLNTIKIWRLLPKDDNQYILQLASAKPNEFFFEVTDQNQNNIINKEKYLGPSFREELIGVNTECNSGNKKAFFNGIETIPLTSDISTIYAKYSEFALFPHEDGVYHLNFSTFYETEIKLPKNTILISQNQEKCSVFYEDFDKVFFYDISFTLKP